MDVGDAEKPLDRAVAYRARWVLPVDRPPISGGVVTVVGGRIAAVGRNESGEPARDLGDVALIPGLINAHTHLEFSLLNKPLGTSGMPFVSWLAEVVAWRASLRRGQSDEDWNAMRCAAIARGRGESKAAGAAGLGEIAPLGLPSEEYEEESEDQPSISLQLFGELLGLAADRVEPLYQLALEYVARQAIQPRIGLSPHAPYTVHPELLRRTCELSQRRQLRLAMHLAESREELDLLTSQSGPLVPFLAGLGAWHPGALPLGSRPLDYLQMLATAHHALVIHGNYLTGDEIDYLAAQRDRLSLVYCPRTHAYFQHDPYPLAKMLAAGVHLAVGTDSRASNPDLQLWEELRHIAQHHPRVPPEAILRIGTLSGAEALDWSDVLGSLRPGKKANFAVVPLVPAGDSPYETLFSSQPSTCYSLHRTRY